MTMMIKFHVLEPVDQEWRIKKHLAIEILIGDFHRMYDLVAFKRLYFAPEEFDGGM